MPNSPNIFDEAIMQLPPEEIAKELGVDLSLFGKLKEQVEEVVEQVEEIQETINFGIPDAEQQKMIDSWDDDFKRKMKGVLTFTDITTEITLISGNILIFSKKQNIKGKMSLYNAEKEVEKIGERLLTKEEFEELFQIFNDEKQREILKLILGVVHRRFWTSSYCNEGYYQVNFKTGNISPDNFWNKKFILSVYDI